MHHDDTAFNHGTSQETEDAGETSISWEWLTNRVWVTSEECIESDGESVQSGECGESVTMESEADAKCEMDTIKHQKYGVSNVKESTASAKCDRNSASVDKS